MFPLYLNALRNMPIKLDGQYTIPQKEMFPILPKTMHTHEIPLEHIFLMDKGFRIQ